MARSFQHRALSLLVGAAALALVLGLISSRSEAQYTAAPQPIGSWWPPHPRDQVQLYSQGLTLASGGELQLFVVPNDRWLVLVPTGHMGLDATARLGVENGSPGAIRLVEDLGGARTEKARNAFGGNAQSAGPAAVSPLGWTFRPASRVLLTYGDGQVGEQLSYNLFGYLAPL